MKVQEKINKKRGIILAVGVVVFSFLVFNYATSNTERIQKNCETFVEHNGCHLNESQIKDFEAGRRLFELTEGDESLTPKKVCGCVEYEIVPGF